MTFRERDGKNSPLFGSMCKPLGRLKGQLE
jgi:hypothetical protein